MGSEYVTPKYPLSYKDYFELKEIKKKKLTQEKLSALPSLPGRTE